MPGTNILDPVAHRREPISGAAVAGALVDQESDSIDLNSFAQPVSELNAPAVAASHASFGGAGAGGSGSHAFQDHIFFQITHCNLGMHKLVNKGAITASDLGIQELPVVSWKTGGPGPRGQQQTTACLRLDMGSLPSSGLAPWMNESKVSFRDLSASWKQWTVVPEGMWNFNGPDFLQKLQLALSSYKFEGMRSGPGAVDWVEHCRRLFVECTNAKAYGGSQHSFIPNMEDHQEMKCVELLYRAGMFVDAYPSLGFRLSVEALKILSQQMVLHVSSPRCFFQPQPGVAIDHCSLLELMALFDSRSWTKVVDPKKPRSLRPFVKKNNGPRVWYTKTGMLPSREYLVSLLSAAESLSITVIKFPTFHCSQHADEAHNMESQRVFRDV